MKICGVTVDEAGYKVFAGRRFRVPGDFADAERSIENIEFLARNKDYQAEYPQLVAECKKILEGQAKEIREYYGRRDGRKEYQVMRHDDFGGYIKDLQAAHKEAAGARAKMKEAHDKAAEKWKEAQKDRRLSEYAKTEAKMRWLEADRDYKAALSDLQSRTNEAVKKVRAELVAHIDDFYSPNGNRIDEGTVKLLNSGLRLSEKEIERLVSQNVNNPTMLRLIDDHCTKNKIDSRAARVYGVYARSAGRQELDAFDQVCGLLQRAVDSNDVEAAAWGTGNDNFSRFSESAIQNLLNAEIKPAAPSVGGEAGDSDE